MMKFTEILQEVKGMGNQIREAEEKEKNLINSYMEIIDLKERIQKHRAIGGEIVENKKKMTELQITRKILQSNAKIALFNEVLPIALEILKKYVGKPYGEKTKQKISEEVKEKTNCIFYISESTYNIYPLQDFGNTYSVCCGTIYTNGSHKSLLIDNKIQEINFDELELYYVSREYVEDIQNRVILLKQLYQEALKKQKELEEICKKYNDLAVGKINHIYCDGKIYENMQI